MIKDETALISFEGVSFSFPNDKILFEDLNLKFKRGAFYLIQGASGAGKSTLLRLITRLDEPTAGEILFKDKRLSSYHPPMLRRSILYIQQTPTAIDASIRENLLLPFGLKNNRDLKRPDDSHLRELLRNFILEDVDMEDNALTLSVGQLQRLCFIRGLLLRPEAILLDEPASALDEESARIVESTAEHLCRESGMTVLMVSHKGFVPRHVRSTILEVSNGRVKELGWDRKS